MKSWQLVGVGIVLGLILAALGILATNRPAGEKIELVLPPTPPAVPLRNNPLDVLPPSGCQVNLNIATQAELQTLPGIGLSKAQDILDYRAEHGPFKSIEELDAVPGIGPAIIAAIKEITCVDALPAQTP